MKILNISKQLGWEHSSLSFFFKDQACGFMGTKSTTWTHLQNLNGRDNVNLELYFNHAFPHTCVLLTWQFVNILPNINWNITGSNADKKLQKHTQTLYKIKFQGKIYIT